MKKKLFKITSITLMISLLFTNVTFAKEAYMIANAPERVLECIEVPSDIDGIQAMADNLNIIDNGEDYEKKIGVDQWSYHEWSSGSWSVYDSNSQNPNSDKYLKFGDASQGNYSNIYFNNNRVHTGLDNPFELELNFEVFTNLKIYIGSCKEFGDEIDDYYMITGANVAQPDWNLGNVGVTLKRVKGDEVNTSDTFLQWGKIDAKVVFDGENLSYVNDNYSNRADQMPSLEIEEPITSGNLYFCSTGGGLLQMNKIKLSKPAGSGVVKDFYLGLEKFTAADVSQKNMEDAGWTLASGSNTFSSVDGKIITGYGGRLRYDDGVFGGDYTIETKVQISYNALYAKFNYIDDNNYYALVTKWLPVDKVYNTQTQTIDTITRTSYLTGGEVYLIKVSQGVAYLLGNKPLIWYGSSNKITINMTENEDGSETINVTAPVEFTYTDVSGDADGNPFTSGKFYYTGESEGSSIIDYVRIYPTNGIKDLSFDFYVNGVKAETDILAKGKTTIAMPVKYAGIRNKIVVALYEDYKMTDCRIYNASDFYLENSLDLFDTTNCSDNTQIAVMMWNSFDEINSIVRGIPVKTVK